MYQVSVVIDECISVETQYHSKSIHGSLWLYLGVFQFQRDMLADILLVANTSFIHERQ